MKTLMMILIITIAATSVFFGQKKMSNDKNSSVETQIIALEKQAWQEWSNKNTSFVQNFLAPND